MALLSQLFTALLLLHFGLHLVGGSEAAAPQNPSCPASAGVPGTPGRDGRDGRDGVAGPKGERGEPGASHRELINSLQEELKSLAARLSLIEKAASFATFVKVGQKNYVSDGLKKKFSVGVKFCSDAGGKLALPRNLEENQKLSGVLNILSSPHMFIGASDQKAEGNFVDLDGKALDFFSWNAGEPNNYDQSEGCIVIDKNSFWHDVNCDSHFPVVCEIQ